ncbi:type III restriction enzyme [Arthrobacter pascens]|uniref:DEAD/DEAH box helicase n=1 Tax=Arthrobacter pascens TaxID=1677 RepID=UPI002789CA71|nr:DEAD/DEAH box helicase family protein [Arthrobacter pascens]MDQ0636359.1 type III restriction enzyme [Arthrobacter pascens]
MKIPLIPFQTEAAAKVLSRLDSATKTWHATRNLDSPQTSAFALSSVTGSGKTVIAATVIEAILTGSESYNINPVPGATFLWLNYDPSLNSQTLGVFQKFADRLSGSNLVIIENTFALDKLEAGKVYFLNLGLLGSKGKLTKPNDDRPFTFWDTLRNTITADDRTLYVVVDEAHVGMKAVNSEDNQSILQRVIRGNGDRPGMPIVWGISATPKHFREGISAMLPGAGGTDVAVDPSDVQDSGLLKQKIALALPGEKQKMWTTLLGEAIADLNASTAAWEEYCNETGRSERVVPLLVLQLPDRSKADTTAEDRLIGEIMGRLSTDLDDFTEDCVAHVLGDRGTIETKAGDIPKVDPDTVAADTGLRVLIAKEAITAGWDCPRAEVLLSLRTLNDDTAITQMLGRMVRTPLAKTTEVERLDLVACYVPYFDRTTALKVVNILTGDQEPDGREKARNEVNINAKMFGFNPDVSAELREVIAALPSVLAPQAKARPVTRLKSLTALLNQHGIGNAPVKTSEMKICHILDGKAVQFSSKMAEAKKDVLTATLSTVTKGFGSAAVEDTRDTAADLRTVRAAFNDSNRALSGMGATYYKHLRVKMQADGKPLDERDMRAHVAAMGRVPEVVADMEAFCDQLVQTLFQQHQDDINTLGKEVRADFDGIRKQAEDPQEARIVFKEEKSYGTTTVAGDALPSVRKHVYADAEGQWPVEEKLVKNSWESAVLAREVKRPAVLAWYRNPSSAGIDSFRISFEADNRWKTFQPDFLLVEQTADGPKLAIIDPHYTLDRHALAHIKALALYAEQQAELLTRVDSLADPSGTGKLRRLRLMDADVREKVAAAMSADQLYLSDAAEDYVFPEED